MKSNILDNLIKQKLSNKTFIKSIIATSFMIVSYPSFSISAPSNLPIPSRATTTQPTVTSPIAGNFSFWGDFESRTVVGAGNHNWRNIQAAETDRIGLIKDNRGTYARVVVRNGEVRSELVMMQDANSDPIYENLNSGIQRYAFSVKFDPSWRAPAWSIFTQLRGPDKLSTNPAFALEASDRITFSMCAGDISRNRGDRYELANGNLNKGRWIKFILTVKYAADNTGFVKLDRHDEGQPGFTQVLNLVDIPTLQYSSYIDNGAVGDHYMKQGLYTDPSNFTNILYLDGFTRTQL